METALQDTSRNVFGVDCIGTNMRAGLKTVRSAPVACREWITSCCFRSGEYAAIALQLIYEKFVAKDAN